jgi:hypothetical protein
MLYQEEKPQVKATTAVGANLPNTSVDYSLENQMAAGTSFSGIAAGAHLPPPKSKTNDPLYPAKRDNLLNRMQILDKADANAQNFDVKQYESVNYDQG